MPDIEKLLAIEEIKLLRHRWSRLVDEGSWGQIAQLLAPDAELDLKAPFAGIVANLDVRPGEYVQPGVSFASLADVTAFQVETTDLTELNVTRTREGQPVKLTFDAVQGLELPGKVTRIKALGTKERGDILYTVTVKPDRQDDRLLWNMTAAVNIEP